MILQAVVYGSIFLLGFVTGALVTIRQWDRSLGKIEHELRELADR